MKFLAIILFTLWPCVSCGAQEPTPAPPDHSVVVQPQIVVEQEQGYGAGYAWRDNTSGPVCLAKGKTVHILIRESSASTPTARHELCRYTKVGDGSWTRTVVAEGPDWQHCGPVVDFDAWWDKGEIALLAPSDEETKYTAEDALNNAVRSQGGTSEGTSLEKLERLRRAVTSGGGN